MGFKAMSFSEIRFAFVVDLGENAAGFEGKSPLIKASIDKIIDFSDR